MINVILRSGQKDKHEHWKHIFRSDQRTSYHMRHKVLF